jgi:hypothetical protein
MVAVIDAKYSRYATRPPADHLYQVFTCAKRLGARRATLVHPGDGQRDELVIDDVRVTTIGLDTSPRAARPASPDRLPLTFVGLTAAVGDVTGDEQQLSGNPRNACLNGSPNPGLSEIGGS